MPAQSYEAGVLVASHAGERISSFSPYTFRRGTKPARTSGPVLHAARLGGGRAAAALAPHQRAPLRRGHARAELSVSRCRGTGTRKLAALRQGDTLQLTGPAGHGFAVDWSWRQSCPGGRRHRHSAAVVSGRAAHGAGRAGGLPAGLSRRALPP